MSAPNPSPPFRDSDALYIVAKRMERLADAMTSHNYATVTADLAEIQEWLDWLASSIAARQDASASGLGHGASEVES